jgi:hypothetical protein
VEVASGSLSLSGKGCIYLLDIIGDGVLGNLRHWMSFCIASDTLIIVFLSSLRLCLAVLLPQAFYTYLLLGVMSFVHGGSATMAKLYRGQQSSKSGLLFLEESQIHPCRSSICASSLLVVLAYEFEAACSEEKLL